MDFFSSIHAGSVMLIMFTHLLLFTVREDEGKGFHGIDRNSVIYFRFLYYGTVLLYNKYISTWAFLLCEVVILICATQCLPELLLLIV
jgi:hypothetical protein